MKKLLFLSAFVCSFYSSVLRAELFKAEEFFLSNGLHVVIVENHKAPLVKQMLVYKVGAVDNLSGKAGGAHLLEHLMFRGTSKVKDGEFNRIMKDNGAVSNAFTSYDITAYHQFADVSRLEVLMAMEADRMQNLNFDEKAYEAEQKIVLQERKQVVENNPASAYSERLRRVMYNDSPYGWPISGTEDEIRDLSFADAMEFYDNFYAPNNAILVLSGDITRAETQDLVEKYYGEIPAKKIIRKPAKTVDEIFSAKLKMALPNISSITFNRGYMLPNFHNVKGNGYAYIVLSEYLGGGKTSALYKELVRDKKLAVSISAGYSRLLRSNSVFSVSASMPQGADTELFIQNLDEALQQAIKSFDNKMLEKVKKKMLADLVYAKDNPADAADLLGYLLGVGFDLSEVQSYEEKIMQVTVDDVKAAYNEVFKNAAVVEGILLPEETEK